MTRAVALVEPRSRLLGRLAGPVLVLVVMLAAGAVALVFGAEALLSRIVEARLEAETGIRWTVTGKPGLSLRPEPALLIRQLDARPDPAARAPARLEVATVRLRTSLRGLFAAGQPSRIELERPVLHVAAEWWRRPGGAAAPKATPASSGSRPDRLIVREGTVRLAPTGEGAELVLDAIDVDAVTDPGTGVLTMTGSVRVGGEAFRGEVRVAGPPKDGGPVPVGFTIHGPAALSGPVVGAAEADRDAAVITLSKLSGTAAGNRFSGAVVLDLQAKPFLRLDLGFPTLTLSGGRAPTTGLRLDPAVLTALGALDARVALYAGKLDAAPVALSDVSAEARLAGGVVTLALNRASLYGGEAQGSARLSASGKALRHRMEARMSGVRGLPFLTDLTGFTMLDGVVAASIELEGLGGRFEDMTRALSGQATVEVVGGRLNDVNLPSLGRLVAAQLGGGRQGDGQATAFDRLSAKFAINGGRASTADLALHGPVVVADGAGVIDFTDRSMALTVHPKLADRGRAGARLAGLGVPVTIEGPWAAPRVAPDLSGLTLPQAGLPGIDALGGLLDEAGEGLGKLLGGRDAAGALGRLLDAIVPDEDASRPAQPRPRRPSGRPEARP